jgi:WD40 repeat protein
MLWSPKTLNPRAVFRKSKMTDLWKKRKISTFEYLISINRMAGRSFNDLANYPVFPWVLADYTSESIDLDDCRVYRDLTKPIGALNQDRLAQLLERYSELEAFGFSEAEKFLYGSHYSSPGIVLHFLMRQEPFTTMHIQLQSGRFDCADRLFLDVASSWNSCMTSSSDMKELVPEFFYLPEILLNTNGFPLGRTQSGKLVDNVGLPPWAKGSAYEFVRINRLALESDYVSQNLSYWIDLVFGFKQRGPEAEAAHNIFHHLSYEGSVDLDKIASQVDREAAESHIQNFGQTPCQLITLDPHPTRGPSEECWKPLISDTTTAGRLKCYTPSKQFANMRSEYAKGAVVKLLVLADALFGIYADMSIGSYRWNPKSKDNRLRMDRLRPLPGREFSTSRLSLKKGSELSTTAMDDSRYAVGPSSFALAMTGFSKEDLRKNSVIPSNILMSHGSNNVASLEGRFFMASSAYWDETIKIHSADGFRVVTSATGGHNGPIRIVTTGDGGGIVASGGEDATVRIWVLDDPDLANALCDAYVQTALGPPSDGEHLLRCCHVLWGHDSPITSLALNSDLDAVVSGSQTGRICIHSVHRGEFIRSFTPPVLTKTTKGPVAIGSIALGSSGLLVVHCEDHSLHTFTLNAVRLSSRRTGEKLHDMRLCSNDQFLITGGEACQVKVWTVPDLRVCAVLDLAKHGPIRCIGLTPEDLNPAEQFLFIGSDDGMITIVDNDHFGKNTGSEQF